MNRKMIQKLLLLCMMSLIGHMSFAQSGEEDYDFQCGVSPYLPNSLSPDFRLSSDFQKKCTIFKVYINLLKNSSQTIDSQLYSEIEQMKENLQETYNEFNIYFEFEPLNEITDDYFAGLIHPDTHSQMYEDEIFLGFTTNEFDFNVYRSSLYQEHAHIDVTSTLSDGIEIFINASDNFIVKDHVASQVGEDDIPLGPSLGSFGGELIYPVERVNGFPNVEGVGYHPEEANYRPFIHMRPYDSSDGSSVVASTTPIHELGHNLGLFHTFHNVENDPENFDVGLPECLNVTNDEYSFSGYNCENVGDYICDTPLDMSRGGHASYVDGNCDLNLPTSVFSSLTIGTCEVNGNYDPMISNYMSYYPNHCKNTFTPQQIDRIFGYIEVNPPAALSACETSSSSCKVLCSTFYDNDNIVISENTSWTSSNIPITGETGASTGVLRISRELRIESGKVLTLADNVRLEMGENAKIIVERGALLQVNGATITKACDNAWSGIEVWGDGGDLSQSTAYQGKVDLNQGTLIEFAKDGITTSRYDDNGNRDFTSFGGIVEADGATFKNCRRAVEFMSYHRALHPVTGVEQNNKSRFEQCNFIVDNNYLNNLTAGEQITMWDTKGIRILGCTFNSTNTTLQNDPEFKAIHTEDATYTIKNNGISSSAASNSFTGFYTGIFSSMSRSKMHSIVIENSNFNNRRGIIMEGAYRPRVTENHFSADLVGVYFDHCISYKMEDNSFDDNGGTARSYGLVIRQSGNQANIAYNNDFDGLYVATQAQGGNRGNIGLPNSGLKYTCNAFQADNYDMSVIALDPVASFQGISATQGDDDNSATNRFIDTVAGLTADNDIQNGADNVVYYYFGTTSPSNTLYPADKSASVGDGLATAIDNCISNFNHGTTTQGLIGLLNTVKGEIDGRKATLHAMIDGGDTQSLTQEVIYSTYADAAELYYELMSKSPALSIEVMMQAIEKEYDLPQILLKQILEANPHAAKSREIQDKLDERLLPLPEYMREQINAGLNIVTAKENLEAALSSNYAELARIYNELLYRYSDGVDASATNFESLLASIDNPHYRYQLAMYYLEIGNPSLARTTFDNIPTDFQLSRATTLEYQDWQGYMGILLDVADAQRSYTNLTPNELTSITTIANSHSYNAGQARALLRQIQDVSYDYPVYDPADQTWNNVRKASVTSLKAPIFGLYPNPANDIVTIELKDGMELIAKDISIYDITGRMMDQITWETFNTETTIDLRNYVSGIYIVKITGKNQEALASQLLTIQ